MTGTNANISLRFRGKSVFELISCSEVYLTFLPFFIKPELKKKILFIN